MSADRLSLLLAVIGDRRIALRSDEVAAVLPLPRLQRPPSTPPPVLGFADVGGQAIAVIAPLVLLGEAPPPTPDLYSHLILLAGDVGIALLVDRVIDHLSLPKDAMRAVAPAETANGCIVALFGDGDEATHLLAADRLLIEAERRRIATLVAALAERRAASAA